jgi:hypothetical protein
MLEHGGRCSELPVCVIDVVIGGTIRKHDGCVCSVNHEEVMGISLDM